MLSINGTFVPHLLLCAMSDHHVFVCNGGFLVSPLDNLVYLDNAMSRIAAKESL
jgi:hypothetical protein